MSDIIGLISAIDGHYIRYPLYRPVKNDIKKHISYVNFRNSNDVEYRNKPTDRKNIKGKSTGVMSEKKRSDIIYARNRF